MTNAGFAGIEQYRDVETLGLYAIHAEAGHDPTEFIAGANANSRDNARTPMQWSDAPQSGFTSGTPWIEVNPNYPQINVAAAAADPGSVLGHYRRLVALRKAHPIIVHGRYAPCLEDHPQVMAYTRSLDGQRLSVLANFGAAPVTLEIPAELEAEGTCLISNHAPRDRLAGAVELGPYEAVAVLAGQGSR